MRDSIMGKQEFTAILEREGDRYVLTALTEPRVSVSGDSTEKLMEELKAKVAKGFAAGEIRVVPPEPQSAWSPPSLPEEVKKVFRLAMIHSDKKHVTMADIKSAAASVAGKPGFLGERKTV